MKIKSNTSWKSIPLSQSFFANLESASAVCGGIEELSDYTLVTKGKKSGKVLKRPLSCPKKATLTVDDVQRDGPPAKKVAKKNVFNVVDTENVVPKEGKIKSKNEKKKVKGADKPHINSTALNVVKTNKPTQEDKTPQPQDTSTRKETSSESKSKAIVKEKDTTSSDKANKSKTKK